ncbi:hypothetical protein [Nitrospira sp. Nam74]
MDYIVETEVESVLRTSHADQIEWLQAKFKIPLTKDLSVWPVFIELTERRNLFVHCDGIVSNQYLSVCNKHSVVMNQNISVGTSLDATPEYFEKAYLCIFEIAVKLAHVLWRKAKKEDLENADDNLLDIAFDLLKREEFTLAAILLDFATVTLKKHSSDVTRRAFVINRAQAYKWLGQQDLCEQLLNAEDWSACDPRFHLSVAVLLDKVELACNSMKAIGKSGNVTASDYRDWPLFRELRKSHEFLRTYEEVFGEPFAKIEKATELKGEAVAEAACVGDLTEISKAQPEVKAEPIESPTVEI